MHRFKRVLSILLASLTVFSSTHVVALAEGIDQLRTDLNAAETGGSVVLSENMEKVEPGDTEADTSSTPETDTETDTGSAPETDTEADVSSVPETDTETGASSAPETDTEAGASSAPETGDGSASTPGTGDGTSSTPEVPDTPAALDPGSITENGVTLTYGENTLFPDVGGVDPVLSVSRDDEYNYDEILTQHFPTISEAKIYTVDINGGHLEGNDHSLSLPAGEGSAVFRIDGNTVSLLNAASDGTNLTVDGAGTGTYAVARFMTPEEIAEYYYGKGGAGHIGNVEISGGKENVEAGEILQYSVRGSLLRIADYLVGGESTLLADTYDEVVLRFKLPEGLSIVNSDDSHRPFGPFTDEDGDGVWEARASNISAISDSSFYFTLQLQVDGNGAVSVGKEYIFTSDALTLTASFTALDKTDPGHVENLGSYEKQEIADLTSFVQEMTATSPDTWALSKTPEGVEEGADTVTFQWTVSAGLAGTDEEGHTKIISDPGTYARNGRAPFVDSSFDITEVLAVLDTDGQTELPNVQPISLIIKPNFGNEEEIVLIGDGAVADPTIPYDTCGANGLTGVDPAAPYHSKYTVTAVYNKGDFTRKWKDYALDDTLIVRNTATMTYQLKGWEQAREAPATVDAKYIDLTEPAALQVEKLIEAYNSNSTTSFAEYNDYTPLPQTVTFTVTNESGSAELYKFDSTANGNRGGYINLNSNEITLTAGQPFPIYYLEPGTYTIKEGKMANTTPVGGEAAREWTGELKDGETPTTVTFTNKEALGGLTFKKVDSLDGQALPGAEFALYDNENCTGGPVATATTGSDGTATIGRLVPGTYYLKETKAPEGYVIADDEPIEVVIEANKVTELEDAIQNDPNSASVTLTKYLDWNGKKTQITSSNYADEFKGAFTLQKKVGEDWVEVEEHKNLSINVNTNVVNVSDLPVYDENNELIKYRFAEKLPEGWHPAPGTSVDSDETPYVEFDLVDQLGTGTAKAVEMYNRRNGSIDIRKYVYTAGKPEGEPQSGVSFQLYIDTDSNGVYELYLFNGTVGKDSTDENGHLTITDLPTDRTYYLVEDGQSGEYAIEPNNGTWITINEQKVYAFEINFQDANDLSLELEVRNVKQERKVTLYKTDAYTEEPIGGAVVTIESDGKYYDAAGKAYDTAAAAYGQAGGLTILKEGLNLVLPVGTYTVTEVTAPANYVKTDTPITFTVDAVGSLDIKTAIENRDLTNTPYPKLLVEKKIGEMVTTGVTFEVYTKTTDGSFAPYQLNGTTLTLTAGTAIQLPAGKYYLHEIVPTDDNGIPSVLDPDIFYKEEDNRPEDTKGEYDSKNNRFYFEVTVAPVDLTEGKKNDTTEVTINNLSNTGTLTLTKKDSVSEQPLAGAAFKLEATGVATKTGTTNEKGELTFTGPVYDANGQKITYTLTETAAPEGYYLDTTDKTSQSGLTLAEGTVTDAGTFTNTPLRTFTINKTYSHNWEYPFTGKEYPMPGVRLALYVKEDGSYALVTDENDAPVEATTGSLGDATFTGLENRKYVAVEVSIPQEGHPLFTEDYRYMTPAGDGKEYLADTDLMQDGNLPTTLTQEQIARLNTATLGQGIFKDGEDKDTTSFSDTLKNEVHWAQLRIDKFKMDDADKDDKYEKVSVNYAQFDLYMQVVSEGAGPELSFDADNCTLIGQYTSGTLVNAAGERQTGKFATDILDADETVVYWLVETKAGPGSAIKPKNAITLFVMDNGDDDETTTRFTNDSKYEYEVEIEGGETETKTANCTTTCEYKVDDITEQSIENDPLYDGGPPRYALVKIAKWATEYVQNEDGEDVLSENYTPLPNARYELWIVDENGQKQGTEPFDILTVGMENIPPADGGQADSHTAWAVSDVLDFKQLNDEYGNKEGNIIWNDEDGIGHLRMALQEVASPEGFVVDERTYYFIVDFKPDPADELQDYTTENETFFVSSKDITGSADEENAYRILDTFIDEEENAGQILWFNSSESELTGSYRLLNLRVDSYNLSIHKYGYTVNGNTEGRTVAELDAYFAEHPEQRTPLEGVEFTLQYYDFGGTAETGGWRTYASKLTTDSNGTYRFMEGLPAGRYRLIETKSAAGYGNTYNGPDNAGTTTAGVRAIRFTIPLAGGSLNLYDPELVELRFQKTDMDGNGIGGATFKLTPTKDGKVVEEGIQPATSDADGWVTFTVPDIEGAKWTLTETSAPDGFSNAYFEEFFRQAYAGNDEALALVDGGAALGNVYGFAGSGTASEPIVTGQIKLDLSKPVENLRNPTTGEFTIQKVDEDGKTIENNPATFEVRRKAFSAISGTITLDTVFEKYTPIGNGGNGKYQTDAEGKLTLSDLDPGIYAIEETDPPTGFELDPTVRYVVITGGMDITVVPPEGASSDVITYVRPGEPSVTIKFQNKELVSVTVEKKVNVGSLPDDPSGTEFKLTLTGPDGHKGTETGYTENVTIKNGESGTFDGLKQDATYTLTEENIPTGYELESVKIGDVEIKPVDGKYTIIAPKRGERVTITVTNRLLKAEATILKVGEENKPLSGATFDLYGPFALDEEITKDALTAEKHLHSDITTGADGTATFQVGLDNREGNKFALVETTAPDGYVKDVTPHIFTLTPGESATADNHPELRIENRRGITLQLNKFGGLRGHNPAPLSGVTFTLWQQDGENWQSIGTLRTENGTATSVPLDPGGTYAVSESSAPAGYAGLEGIWPKGSDTPCVPVTIQTASGQIEAYQLRDGGGTAGVTYSFDAYNIPTVTLTVHKEDVTPGLTDPKPEATVALYEVSSLTVKQIAAINGGDFSAVSDLIGTGTNVGEGTGTDVNFTTVQRGETYLAVETEVSGNIVVGTEPKPYNTLIKDDTRVLWAQAIAIPEDGGTGGQYELTLKNLYGEVTVSLDKTADKTKLSDLYSKDKQQVTYTITPTVSNPALPLTGFTLEDSGLTAQYGKGNQRSVTLPDGWYSIDFLTLQKPLHETDTIKGIDNKTYPIEATITWEFWSNRDPDVQVVTFEEVAEDGEKAVTPPAGAKSFTITWSSPALADAADYNPEWTYTLGTNFNPGKVLAEVTIHKLDPDDISDNVKPLVDQITNDARVTYSHAVWDKNGNASLAPGEKRVTSQVTVSKPKAPTISLSKTAETDDGSVNTGDSLAYNITIQNTSQNGLPMTDPVLIDLLPLGTSLPDSGIWVELVGEQADLTLSPASPGYFDGYTYLYIPLSGSLPAGESVTVRVYVNVDRNAASYGSTLTNHAFVTSTQPGICTGENPTGASFQDKNNGWPKTLEDIGKNENLSTLLSALQGALERDHNNLAGNGYIHAHDIVTCNSSGGAVPVKSAFGDVDDPVYRASGNTAEVSDAGTVFYQLSVTNPAEDTSLTNIVVLDRLPSTDDSRRNGQSSEWNARFAEGSEGGDLLLKTEREDGLPSAFTVKLGDETLSEDKYDLYFYTGDQSLTEAAAIELTEKIANDGSPAITNDWKTLDTLNATGDGDRSDGRRSDVSAFLVVLDQDIQITKDAPLAVEYQLRAPPEAPEGSSNALKVAENDFIVGYKQAGFSDADSLSSNFINTVISSERVGVGGDIWIDANDNGKQDDGELGDGGYQDYAISQRIRDALTVTLQIIRSTEPDRFFTQTAGSQEYAKPEGEDWNGHFEFDDLPSGRRGDRGKDPHSENTIGADEEGRKYTFQYELDPTMLRARTSTYVLEISSNGDAKFKAAQTPWFDQGRSDDPRELTEDNPLSSDSNFTQVQREDGTLTDNYYSERFYLWPVTDSTDTSKDFGVVPLRDLTVHKVAEGTDQPLEGATFTLYGPYERGHFTPGQTITEADLTGEPRTGKTDADGNLTFEGLLYFKAYVLVEETPANGYELEGATADSDNEKMPVEKLTLEGKTAWLLPVPDKQNTEFDQTVTVSNKRHYEPVTWSPEVTKQLEGSLAPNPPRTFTFTLTPDTADPADGYTLKDDTGEVTVSTIGETTTVVFDADAVTFTKADTYTFTIAETAGGDSDIVYDTTTWTVTVNVTPDEGEGKLKASVEYVVVGSTDPANTTGAAFVNTMQEADLLLGKTVSGSRGDRQRDFTFQIRLTGPDAQPLNGDYPTIGGATEPGIVPPADGTLTVKDGVSTVTLRHGQTVTIQGLPAGTVYTVTETDGSGYRTTYTNKDGTLVAGTTAEAWVENYRGGGGGGGDRDPDPDPHPHRDPDPGDRPHRDPLPDTGLNWTAPALLAGTGIALITAGLLPRRKKKEGDDDAR